MAKAESEENDAKKLPLLLLLLLSVHAVDKRSDDDNDEGSNLRENSEVLIFAFLFFFLVVVVVQKLQTTQFRFKLCFFLNAARTTKAMNRKKKGAKNHQKKEKHCLFQSKINHSSSSSHGISTVVFGLEGLFSSLAAAVRFG